MRLLVSLSYSYTLKDGFLYANLKFSYNKKTFYVVIEGSIK